MSKAAAAASAEAKAQQAAQQQRALDMFEVFEPKSKSQFAILGGVAGTLLGRNRIASTAPITHDEYMTVAKELFEDLCSATDVPPNIVGQCINALDKIILDSRPKKARQATIRLDGGGPTNLDEDNMGEDDGAASKPRKVTSGDDGEVEDDEPVDAVLTEEDMKRAAEEERKRAEAEAAEVEAQRLAFEEEEAKRAAVEENARLLRENARKVSAEVPQGMAVMKRDDDDDMGFNFGGSGGGKKGGKGGGKGRR